MEFGESIREWEVVMLKERITECCCYRDRGSIKCSGTMESKKENEMIIIIGAGL